MRDYLFDKTKLSCAERVLEVGCGTGAILSTLRTSASLHGLDLDTVALHESHLHAPTAFSTRGDAHSLPYPNQTFDITFCHFFLLWVKNPLNTLTEMKRVTKANGYVLAVAEPDYTARTDQPDELAELGRWQNESLGHQGADIGIGVRLANLFFRAGIRIVEAGTIQSRGNDALSLEEWKNEWDVLEFDLAESVSKNDIARLKKLDKEAWMRGIRVLNVPTYFAWGQV